MGSNLNLWKNKQIVLKFDLHGLVETRLHTFLEFTFAHIYHLCTKKYYACSHLEINVCAHSLLKTSLFVSLLLMYIIFSSSWLENTSYWSGASCLDWRTPRTDLAPRAFLFSTLAILVAFFYVSWICLVWPICMLLIWWG